MPRESGIAGAIATGGLNSGMNHGESGGMQGYGGANATMMGMQQAPAAHQYQNPSGAYGGTNAAVQGRATYTK